MYLKIFQLHADFLKALAHPRRLEIVHLLRDQELSVSQIHSMLDLPQSNVSQHLMLLREAGIVDSRKDGKQVYYFLKDPRIIQASDQIRSVLLDELDDPQIQTEYSEPIQNLLPLTHDPVCGMQISQKTASFFTKYKEQKVYFCASGCLKNFNQNPEDYAAKI